MIKPMRCIALALALSIGHSFVALPRYRSLTARQAAADNVEQTLDTSRDKVMTFSYDMSLEPKYDKPTYPGTGNGLGGEEGEYDVSQEEDNEFHNPGLVVFNLLLSPNWETQVCSITLRRQNRSTSHTCPHTIFQLAEIISFQPNCC